MEDIVLAKKLQADWKMLPGMAPHVAEEGSDKHLLLSCDCIGGSDPDVENIPQTMKFPAPVPADFCTSFGFSFAGLRPNKLPV